MHVSGLVVGAGRQTLQHVGTHLYAIAHVHVYALSARGHLWHRDAVISPFVPLCFLYASSSREARRGRMTRGGRNVCATSSGLTHPIG